MVAAAFVKYPKELTPVEPAVTAAAVKLTVDGLHTGEGLVIDKTGLALTLPVRAMFEVVEPDVKVKFPL